MGGLGLIKSLAEKEKQLLERLEAAKKEAEERVKRAEAEAKALLEEAEAKAKALEAQYRERERAETEALLARYRERAEAEAKAVREKAMARLDEAVAVHTGSGTVCYQGGAPCAGVAGSACSAVLLPDELVLGKQIRVPLAAEENSGMATQLFASPVRL